MRFGVDALKGGSAAGALLLVTALGVLGVIYWSGVTDRQHYLQSRNFRLLAVLATQTENVITTRARVGSGQEGATAPEATGALHFRLEAAGAKRPARDATLAAEEALEHIFSHKLSQRAFDTVALATARGRVIYAVGRRQAELQVISLATLLPPGPDGRQPDFGSVATVIAEHPVTLAGVNYRMFLQPCCRGVTAEGAAGDDLMVVGLAESAAMSAAALAISPLLVLAGVILVLGALVSWVFLKLALGNATERVSPFDALQLGASSVFGLAIATILILSTGAYVRMWSDVDGQLEDLASRIAAALKSEIGDAYKQSGAVTRSLLRSPCVRPLPELAPKLAPERAKETEECQRSIESLTKEFMAGGNPYPNYTAVALIDAQGRQRVKSAPLKAAKARIDVSGRPYFQQALEAGKTRDARTARDGGLWRLGACPEGCVLESLWSWTTGEPQVVLAHATGDEALPVAAISVRMSSLMDPVLPAGFEFAVVDEHGMVQFHSDTERNAQENLLLETDQDPRLRALMAARSAGLVSAAYWGRPYRAYVTPALVPGWSIVTLFDKQQMRALVLEWAVGSILLLCAYMALLIAGLLVVFRFGTAWIWPDPLRRSRYGALCALYAGVIASFLMIAAFAETATMLYAGMALPLAALGVTVAVLARRPPAVEGVPRWSELSFDYRLMGTLCLVLASMVPGAAFVAFAHDRHVESYVKYRQIALARALDARVGTTPTDSPRGDGAYASVFYNSASVREEAVHAAVDAVTASGPNSSGGILHPIVAVAQRAEEALEDYLPYYAAASVEMRELHHDRAEDGSWRSTHASPGQLSLAATSERFPGTYLRVTSVVPSLVAVRTLTGDGGLVPSALAVLLLLAGVVAAAWWSTGFVLRQVFLFEIIEPLWSRGRLVATAGQHLLVVCDDPGTLAGQLEGAALLRIAPLTDGADEGAAWRQVRVSVGEAGPAHAVAVPDIDQCLDRPERGRRALLLVERLVADPRQTVLLLSTSSRQAIADSVGGPPGEPVDAARWERLLDLFVVMDRRGAPATGDATFAVTLEPPATPRWRRLFGRWSSPGWTAGRREALLAAEGRPTWALRRICDDLAASDDFRSRSLTRDQVLEEIEERAAPLYRRAWHACSPEERIVLEHVARDGLANAASRPIVRRLLAAGLLRKDPNLRLMNRTFRRFVLAGERRTEVARLEGLGPTSLWDRLRLPFGLGATAAVLFLVTTQREMFDATLTVAAGVTTAMPTLLRLTTLLAQVGPKGGNPPKPV